jgi:hypothetical protein
MITISSESRESEAKECTEVLLKKIIGGKQRRQRQRQEHVDISILRRYFVIKQILHVFKVRL